MISLKHLRGFVALSDTLHFTTAARAVYLSQPAFSAVIRQLETELGVQLVLRSTRAVEITPLGRDFAVTARRLLKDFDGAIDEIRQLKTLERGRVTVAALPSLSTTLLPDVIARFRHEFPQIEVQIRDLLGDDIITAVISRGADFGLGHSQSNRDIRVQPLIRDRLVAICTRRFAPPGTRQFTWRQLGELPLLVSTHGTSIRSLLESAALARNVQLQIALEARQLATLIACAASGIGVAVLPSTGVPASLPETLVRTNLVDPIVHRELSLLTLAQGSLSPAAAALCDMVLDSVAKRRNRRSQRRE